MKLVELRRAVTRVVRNANLHRKQVVVIDLLTQAISDVRYYKQMRPYVIYGAGTKYWRILPKKPYQRAGRPQEDQFHDLINSAIVRAWRIGTKEPRTISRKTNPRKSIFTIFIKEIYTLAHMGKAEDHVQGFDRYCAKMWRKMRRNKGLELIING